MSSINEIFTGNIATKASGNKDNLSEINAIYQFEITGDEASSWTVDLREGQGVVSEGSNEEADITITVDTQDFKDIVSGTLPGPMAFMSGKLQIQGDMSLAMKLQEVL